jgi:hypothetical protein
MDTAAARPKSLARGLAALSPACQQAIRLQSQALDHKLPFLERTGLRLHLLICKWCRRYTRQLKALHHAAPGYSDSIAESAPHALSAAAHQRIKERLEQERK